ncbi:hypothetical protein AGABI2DRAFT_194290 [Agaricus bisporus var. bisporus H97]|uniref:hypothetical protein n=1 Tax=Agaricus bisporus var. bisporus (strain H97 / ATCC MYA-4626 / FGSC 10389) TaxID=936046 RepID=UPI00029F73E9|nr:hypothetical protein AGABI2DRAFT_194290 [Agaricus bisporus var. bisporus H97]EKV45332.1 hypothetical protein AGABI2DRAFT_194290 [Agaricus bisporus var. bisporus H97]
MMAVLFPHPHHNMCPRVQRHTVRRSATTVVAGFFDPRPPRDVLTSLLNGIGPNKEVEGEEEVRKARKKKESKKDHPRASSVRRESTADATPVASSSSLPQSISAPLPKTKSKKHSFWSAHPERPNIQLMPVERFVSVTPPPGYSPVDIPFDLPTPGPSDSTATSRTSSKRPRTPDDDEDIIKFESHQETTPQRPRKKRIAHKKGWKGWIEGSPVPSDKLINLDSAPVLQERRLRSGKNFDAWV